VGTQPTCLVLVIGGEAGDAVTARSCKMQKCGICNNKRLQVNTCSWFGRENGSPYAYAICVKCGKASTGTKVEVLKKRTGVDLQIPAKLSSSLSIPSQLAELPAPKARPRSTTGAGARLEALGGR
jgi:hypothetical protein